MGHLLWIAVEESTIIGLVALGRNAPNLMAILHLQVSESHKNSGIGSALIKAVIAGHPVCEFVAIPFEGTEEFYARLRFIKAERRKMRRPTGVKG
jgi:predicted N-acetyltransferase YhbS